MGSAPRLHGSLPACALRLARSAFPLTAGCRSSRSYGQAGRALTTTAGTHSGGSNGGDSTGDGGGSGEFTLRPAFELALRASCLQLVLARWGLESAAALGIQGEKVANDDDRKVRAVEAIANAAFDGGLEDYLTAKERALLEKPYQTWGQDDFDQGMHWESFGVLQWLLGRQHKIPHYFANFDRASLFQATGVMPANPSTIDAFVNSYMSAQAHHLLDTSRLRHEVAVAEAWNWRARVQVVMDLRDQILEEAAAKAGRKLEQGPPEEEDEARVVDRIMAEKRVPRSLRRMVRDLDQVVRTATGRAIERSLIENSADDDFGITVELKPEEVRAGGQRETVLPYSKLDSKVHDSLRRISEARLFAFAWAVSKLEDWDIEHMAELGSIGPIGSIWAPDDDHGDSP